MVLLSLMAAPFLYLILVLLAFLASLSLSCPNSVRCGNIDINYPFFENITGSQKCGGKFAIECNGSSAMLQLEGVNYPVLNISYPGRVITIQDQMFSQYLHESSCSFLYDFAAPIHHFNPFGRLRTQKSINSFNCTHEDFDYFRGFFHLNFNSSLCRDYNLYDWKESENFSRKGHPANCWISQATLFEWVLSYSEDDGSLSLHSAGFSHHRELHKDCFICPMTEENCSRNNHAADSSCLCGDMCLERNRKHNIPGEREKKCITCFVEFYRTIILPSFY